MKKFFAALCLSVTFALSVVSIGCGGTSPECQGCNSGVNTCKSACSTGGVAGDVCTKACDTAYTTCKTTYKC